MNLYEIVAAWEEFRLNRHANTKQDEPWFLTVLDREAMLSRIAKLVEKGFIYQFPLDENLLISPVPEGIKRTFCQGETGDGER